MICCVSTGARARRGKLFFINTSFRPVEVVEDEPLTDVRIIDFAHSTHSSMEDKVKFFMSDHMRYSKKVSGMNF
jgi:hypothetical protein